MTEATVLKIPSDYVSVIHESDRIDFLPKHFGKFMLLFERTLYRVASRTVDGCKSGFWEYAYTGNNLPFAFPKNDTEFSVTTMEGYGRWTLPPELTGLYATATAIYSILLRHDDHGMDDATAEGLLELYEALIQSGRAIARETGYGSAFNSLID